jgi:hypothetical protein
MQYKIPVQIENEDPIVLGLSLRQLAILMIGGGISYSIFTRLTQSVWTEVAAFPAIIVAMLTFMIAVFKSSEMTFIPFVLNLIRFHTNEKERKWQKWVDSFQPIDIGFITSESQKKDENIDFQSKIDKINQLNDKLDKI